MKILVLGGAGFIGSSICDCLLNHGHDLRVFERPRIPRYRQFEKHENVEWITGDFSSRSEISGALQGVDSVIHLISTTLPKGSNDNPIYDVQTNIVSTLQLLDEMIVQNIMNITFISSGGTVYGIPNSTPLLEDHQTNPICSYGITKLAIEKYLAVYKKIHGLKPVVLRVANPYGPRQRIETAQGAIAAFLNCAISGKSIQIWGDGSTIRDYVHIYDVAEAFVKSLSYEGENIIFNIGSGVGTSLDKLVSIISFHLKRTISVEYSVAREFDVPKNILDINLAGKHLGWTPQWSIESGILDTIQFLTITHENLNN
jgi:UDP-glucose 4-epimerase